jgi:hypothetical protein
MDHDWASNVMKDRVVWSVYLYKKGIAKHVIFSGNAVYTPYVEGKILAMHTIASGIAGEYVFTETHPHPAPKILSILTGWQKKWACLSDFVPLPHRQIFRYFFVILSFPEY